MRNKFIGILCFLPLLFLTHCGSVPAIYYYRIDYALPEPPPLNSITPATLGVEQFKADILYQGDRIVYRNSPYEVQYYHYRRWVAPPRKIVEEKVLEQFRSSGVFGRVESVPCSCKIDYVLRGKIKAFEEWDEDSAWYGMVSLALELHNAETKALVWENKFSENTKALKKEPVEVVRAISESLKKVVEKAIGEIKQKLKSSPGKAEVKSEK